MDTYLWAGALLLLPALAAGLYRHAWLKKTLASRQRDQGAHEAYARALEAYRLASRKLSRAIVAYGTLSLEDRERSADALAALEEAYVGSERRLHAAAARLTSACTCSSSTAFPPTSLKD